MELHITYSSQDPDPWKHWESRDTKIILISHQSQLCLVHRMRKSGQEQLKKTPKNDEKLKIK